MLRALRCCRLLSNLRNLAIIAHVDHGKTTLVDRMLRQCDVSVEGERLLDCNALERERGITIFSKCTSMSHHGHTLNVVDTPGHADFGGEVERVLGMVDGALLIVDAQEGVMPQTKFVLGKALRRGLAPIVVFNKVDRGLADLNQVHSDVFDLFVSLDATEKQLDFPTLFASAREGWAVSNFLKDPKENLTPLFNAIIAHVPPPSVHVSDNAFRLSVSMIEHDSYVGRVVTGRIVSGGISIGSKLKILQPNGAAPSGAGGKAPILEGRVTKIYKRKGLERFSLQSASVGDIVSIAGFTNAGVGDTLAEESVVEALPTVKVDQPTVAMNFCVNDSPIAGSEGQVLTSLQLAERLRREAENNVSINVKKTDLLDAFEVQGRGELQFGVLIENMRREGYEFAITPPRVLMKEDNGVKVEPVEEVVIEVDTENTGIVLEKLGMRGAILQDMQDAPGNKTKFVCG